MEDEAVRNKDRSKSMYKAKINLINNQVKIIDSQKAVISRWTKKQKIAKRNSVLNTVVFKFIPMTLKMNQLENVIKKEN